MTAKPKQPRYHGRWLASWQADIREELGDLRSKASAQLADLRGDTDANTKAIGGINEKLGPSIWQMLLNAIFAAGIAYAVLKLHGVDIP